MTKSKIHHILLLAAIFLLGLGLRVINLGKLPGGYHRDEMAIGYNAYSLLQTGRDEHGQRYPLNFRSFNDYKLPGLIYSAAASISLLGKSMRAVRLPTALFGSLLPVIAFFFSQLLFTDTRLSFINAGLIAVSLWHVTSSRTAYEPIAGLTLALCSLSGYLLFLKSKNKKTQLIGFVFSLLCFVLSAFFYNTPLLLLPVIFIGWFLILNKKTDSNFRLKALILLLGSGLILLLTFMKASGSKTGTVIIGNPDLIASINADRLQYMQAGLSSTIARLLVNKPVVYFKQLSSGYFSAFDFSYLFIQGDHNPWHSLRSINLGTFHLLTVPFLTIGCLRLLRLVAAKKKAGMLLLVMLIVSPIADAMTIDAPISNRLMLFHFTLTLIIGLGILKVFCWVRANFSQALGWLLISAFFASYIWPLSRYFYLFNQNLHPQWNPRFKEVVLKTVSIEEDYDQVYITPKVDNAYLHFAFFEPIPPFKIQAQAKWNQQGLWFVQQLGKYNFNQLPDISQLTSDFSSTLQNQDLRLLVIDTASSLPENTQPIEIISDYQAQPRWVIYGEIIKGSYEQP